MAKKVLFALGFVVMLFSILSLSNPQDQDEPILDRAYWEEFRMKDIAQPGPEWGEPKLLPFSTSGWEEGGYISPDGRTFYFGYIDVNAFAWRFKEGEVVKSGPLRDTRKRCTLGSLGAFNCGEYPRYDLFFAEREGEAWTEPEPHPLTLTRPVKSIVLVNNRKAYFITSFDKDWKGEDMAYAEIKDGKWGEPVKVEAVSSEFQEDDPYVNEADDEMFFWSNRPAKFRGNNIYRAVKTDGAWQTPQLLSGPVNSDGDDMQTFLFGHALYFVSNRKPKGHPMLILKSERLGENEWGEPQVVISSKFAVGEPSLPADGKRLYFEQIFADGKGNFNPEMMYVEKRT